MRILWDLLPGWEVKPWNKGMSRPAALRIEKADRIYSITGPWVPESVKRTDPVDAACSFIAELTRAYVNEVPQRLCLHAAGAEIGGRLVVFPSTHKAGKSVLSATLAAAGCRLVGDDIVLLDAENGIGISGGFCPRLRLPLPANLRPETRSFIDANSGPTGKRYKYLALDEAALARKEDQIPIGTFVFLERCQQGGARMERTDEVEALKTVIWQNFARRRPSQEILEMLFALVRTVGAFKLTYSRTEEAVALLQNHFDSWSDNQSVLLDQVQSSAHVLVDDRATYPAPSVGTYCRKRNRASIQLNGNNFVADNENGRISFLNETASAVWTALASPMTKSDIVDLLAAAFPGIGPEIITEDVENALRQLVKNGLVHSPEC